MRAREQGGREKREEVDKYMKNEERMEEGSNQNQTGGNYEREKYASFSFSLTL